MAWFCLLFTSRKLCNDSAILDDRCTRIQELIFFSIIGLKAVIHGWAKMVAIIHNLVVYFFLKLSE